MPWEPDELRENPEDRDVLFDLYLTELELRKWPFAVLEGSLESRLQTANEILVHLLASKLK
jgi:hypothetical protein